MRAASWSEVPGWNNDDLVAAWPAFLQSCRALASKPQWLLWRPACDEAKGLTAHDNATLRRFFEAHFQRALNILSPALSTREKGTQATGGWGWYP